MPRRAHAALLAASLCLPASLALAAEPTAAASYGLATKVEGDLDATIIRRIVRAHIADIRHCYNEGLQRDPELAGKLAVRFTIDGGRGHVTGSELVSSDLDDPDVEDCMVKAPTRWTFPKSADGDDVKVTYPFVLSPG